MTNTFDKEDEQYKDLISRETKLIAEKNRLEYQLSEIKTQLEKATLSIKESRANIIDLIEKENPPHQQKCTCEEGLPKNVDHRYSRYVTCLKHLSRYFKNKGCYWCYNTDCSKHGC